MRMVNFKKRHASRGMSLVELMMVMAIMSVVVLAVMSLYVPAHQSTVAQTQLSDVQSNLRLALKTMTRDLLIGGFLVPDNPIIFEASITPTTAENPDEVDFTIRTRAVGSHFARISGVSSVGGGFRLTVSDADMVGNFSVGSKVRLFEPISSNEIIKDTGTDAARAYTVLATGTNTVDISAGALTLSDIITETVMLRVKDENQPPLQKIRYSLNNGALERKVNDDVQVLARNVAEVKFTAHKTSFGRVQLMDIELTGKTKALKNDAISGEKTRTVKTSVKLRNIF